MLSRRRFLRAAGAGAAWTCVGLRARVAQVAPGQATMRAVALRAFDKHKAVRPLTHYTGILSLHGLARLAVESGNAGVIARAREELLPFVRGERTFRGNFPNYLCGGNGAALLLWRKHLPEAAEAVRREAEAILGNAPRSRDGIVTMPSKAGTDAIFIDAAFAICPFLAFAGRALAEPKCVEEAVAQITRLVEVLRDTANGLLHQARGFSQAGRVTEDHWSRGNGWGLLALVETIDALGGDHPRRPALVETTCALIEACLQVQDADGMWHQELTQHSSYVETSGTGLILYAIGRGLRQGWLAARHRVSFERGIRGLLAYIDPDGSIRNTCVGCLSPGAGTIADYVARPWALNDPHAFGPVVLAFGVADALGVQISSAS